MTISNAASMASRVAQVVEALRSLIAGEHTSAEMRARRLEELVEKKTALLDMAAHELRRPLAMTRDNLSMIRGGRFGELPRTLVQPVLEAVAGVQQMTALVDGLAAIALLDDPARVVDLRPCRMVQLIGAAITVVQPEAAAKNIYIEPYVHPWDLEVAVDAHRLRVAAVNLLASAVKDAPTDSVLTLSAHSQKQDEVAVAVGHHGDTADPAETPRLFDSGYRTRGAGRRESGLGLCIARKLTELHGGRITVERTPGGGSTYTIVWPSGLGQQRHPESRRAAPDAVAS